MPADEQGWGLSSPPRELQAGIPVGSDFPKGSPCLGNIGTPNANSAAPRTRVGLETSSRMCETCSTRGTFLSSFLLKWGRNVARGGNPFPRGFLQKTPLQDGEKARGRFVPWVPPDYLKWILLGLSSGIPARVFSVTGSNEQRRMFCNNSFFMSNGIHSLFSVSPYPEPEFPPEFSSTLIFQTTFVRIHLRPENVGKVFPNPLYL